MRDLLITLIVFGGIPFIFYRPYIGILLWSWIGYMNPHRLSFGFAYDFPFAQVIAIATILAFLISRDKKSIDISLVLVLWALYFLWTCVTTYFALYHEQAMPSWDIFMKICLVSLLTVFLINTKDRLNALIWVIVISIGFYGVKGGIFTIFTGGTQIVWGPFDSFIEDNNALALALIMILPLMRYLHINTKNKSLKLFLLISMLLTAVSIFGSQSRGAFVGLSAMMVFLILKSRHRALFLILVIISAPIIYTSMPDSWHERMDTITNYKEDGSAIGRINAWWFAYNMAKHRPLVGGGYNSFTQEQYKRFAPNPDDVHGAHSIYFENLGEHGFVGLVLFLLLGIAVYRMASRVIKKSAHYDDMIWANDLAAMVQVSLVGYAVTGIFLELAQFDLLYQLIAIVLVLGYLVKRRALKTNDLKEDDIDKAGGVVPIINKNYG